MVTDTTRLRASVFERTGIAIDENDPIIAVLVATAQQTEEIGARLLRRANPVRVVIASVGVALLAAGFSSWATWELAKSHARAERAEWVRQQTDPRTAALLASSQGKAALQLAALGVADLLANCRGRRSWRIEKDYCVPVAPDGRPDGFRIAPRARS